MIGVTNYVCDFSRAQVFLPETIVFEDFEFLLSRVTKEFELVFADGALDANLDLSGIPAIDDIGDLIMVAGCRMFRPIEQRLAVAGDFNVAVGRC